MNGLLADRSPAQMILASLDTKSLNHGITYQNLHRHEIHSDIQKVPVDAPIVGESRQAMATVLRLVDPLKEIHSREEFSKAVQILDRDIEYLSAIPVKDRTPFQNRHLLQSMAEKRLWIFLAQNLPHVVKNMEKSLTDVDAEIERIKRETNYE